MGLVKRTFEIKLDEKNQDHNIGQFILDREKDLVECHANAITVATCNATWHGSFLVPSALGFSTPLSLCIPGHVSFCQNPHAPDVLEQLKKWKQIYRGSVIRQDNITKFRSDCTQCTICTCDYKEGEDVITLRLCKHVFHKKCFNNWKYRKSSLKDLIIEQIMEARSTASCPLCRTETG